MKRTPKSIATHKGTDPATGSPALAHVIVVACRKLEPFCIVVHVELDILVVSALGSAHRPDRLVLSSHVAASTPRKGREEAEREERRPAAVRAGPVDCRLVPVIRGIARPPRQRLLR